MNGKLSDAIRALRESLGATQLELAVKLDIGGHSVPHYETGRMPDAVITARLCRAAHEARRDDLADIFASRLPGVEEGLLVPVWRLPKELQPEMPARKVLVSDDVGAELPPGHKLRRRRSPVPGKTEGSNAGSE
jgi:transcriptional regulator with XRE-family HTH domain